MSSQYSWVAAQLGGLLDTLTVFSSLPIREVDVVPLHAAGSGLHVGAELLEGSADVRPAVGVVDGRR